MVFHKKYTYYVILLGLFIALFTACNSPSTPNEPLKPDGFFDYAAFEKDAKQKEYKHMYKDQLYFAKEGVNVDSIRSEHMLAHLRKRKTAHKAKGVETFANGALVGEWFERGPTNEAGDLREVDYDAQNDSLYVLTTAGFIFKGNLNGNGWRLLNDQIQFNTNVLNHIKKSGKDRLIALYGSGTVDNKRPRYSDDMGKTWTLATGIGSEFYDGWGSAKKIIELSDGKTLYYMVHTWKRTPWGSAIEVYKSTNWGESFSLVLSMNGGGYDFNDVDMWKPVDSDNIYIVDNDKKQFYSLTTNTSTGVHQLSSPTTINGLGDGQIKLTGRFNNGNSVFYALVDKYMLYKTTNFNGSNWTKRSDVVINGDNEKAFRNVFMANPLNNQLYMGGFQLYTSNDELTWSEQYSYWWTYYDKNIAMPARKNNMHVDMMDMEFFRKADNTPFFLILNHAGIYVSYDNMKTTTNLGQTGLNVVTLYDHATAPDGTIFCGAQDKGTFKNTSNNNANTNIIETENQTTGDGMRELFFNSGNSWFGFLQNGSMVCMPNKNTNTLKWWQVPGDDIPGWINPLENHPDPAAKKCYVAGGNINGTTGSYLIQMEVSWSTSNASDFQWKPTQYNFDFRANSRDTKSNVKAIGATKADYNRLYVATNDGTFFSSTNGGTTWSKSTYNIPTTLVPWDMAVSSTDANNVILCGTGWSNTGVYQSKNGGQTFTPLSTNIPSATFFDLALSTDEEILFAATSEGPYAYVFADNQWYDISGNDAPYVDYRSVEYIEANKTVRFGTYGRGIWDFALQTEQIVTDCNNTPNGTAFQDYCNQCVGGTTGKTACQVAYTTHTIPGTIEAEAYDHGGSNISYFDATTVNEGNQLRLTEAVDIGAISAGGYYLGWTATGEWIEFTVNVAETASYDIDYTVASPNSNGRFHLEMNNAIILPSVTVNSTGAWDVWKAQTSTGVLLNKGTHVLKIYIDNTGLNIDKLVFKKSVISSVKANFERNVAIYPNPVRDGDINIKVPMASNLRIFNAKGEKIYESFVSSNTSVNTKGWAKGVFLLEFSFEGTKVVKKVVVE